MVVTTLVENLSISKEFINKPGLCIHISTNNHNILFDLGPDDTFIKNADKLNIDIKEVDIVVISHGHKDHGGGLEAFIKHNNKAKIYISRYGFNKHYVSVLKYAKFYVGLNQKIKVNKRIVFTDEIHYIDEGITVLSDIRGNLLMPKGNRSLLVKDRKRFILDDFKHEQHLIINENGKNTLFSGCSHKGILNIVQESEDRLGSKIDFIIGGLHLYNPINRNIEDSSVIEDLGNKLLCKNVKMFTCHCTGFKAFNLLRNKLGSNLEYIKTGDIVELTDES